MSYNILIVDDSAIIRSVVKKTILMSGLEVGKLYEAGNGIEALEKLNENWVDIVFADINMPEMDGIKLVDEMSRNNMMISIPVVIVSSERNKDKIDKLKSKGIRAFLKKPFKPELFKEVVDDILGMTEGLDNEQ